MTTQYKMIESGTPAGLEEGVNEYLQAGWQLLGIPMHAAKPVGDNTTIHLWVQAIVKD